MVASIGIFPEEYPIVTTFLPSTSNGRVLIVRKSSFHSERGLKMPKFFSQPFSVLPKIVILHFSSESAAAIDLELPPLPKISHLSRFEPLILSHFTRPAPSVLSPMIFPDALKIVFTLPAF